MVFEYFPPVPNILQNIFRADSIDNTEVYGGRCPVAANAARYPAGVVVSGCIAMVGMRAPNTIPARGMSAGFHRA